MLNPNAHVLDYVDAYLHDLLTPSEDQACVHPALRAVPRSAQAVLTEARKRYDALLTLPNAHVPPRLLRSVERMLSVQGRKLAGARRFALMGVAAAALLIGCFHLYFLTLSPSSYELRVLGQSEVLPGSEASLRSADGQQAAPR